MRIYFIAILICFVTSADAQYRVGDLLPDVTLGYELFKPDNPVKLYAFKDSLLVLDIMSLYCSSCISALPKYDSLQKKIAPGARLLVLINSPLKNAESFYKRLHWQKYSNLRFIHMDTGFATQFNITSVPYYVWIEQNRKISAITGSAYVKLNNIYKATRWEDLSHWPDIGLSPEAPLMDYERLQNTGGKKAFFSLLTSYQPGLDKRQKWEPDTLRNAQFWSITNLPISSMYQVALKGLSTELLLGNRFLIQVKDSSRFFYNSDLQYRAKWDRDNSLSYEAVFPLYLIAKERHQKLLEDLNFFLGLNGRIERQEKECWVIERAENQKGERGKTLDAAELQAVTDGLPSVTSLLHTLSFQRELGIFVSDIKEEGTVPVRLSAAQRKDIDLLKEGLAKYGLRLKKDKRNIEIFILSDR